MAALFGQQAISLKHYILPGFVASLLFHIIFGFSLSRERLETTENLQVFETTIVRLPEKINRQIVAPSNTEEKKADQNTKLLSEKDTNVKEQKIRRGDSPDSGPAPGQAASSSQKNPKTSTENKQPQSSKSITTNNTVTSKAKDLASSKLDLTPPTDFLKSLSNPPKKPETVRQATNPTNSSQPFSRAPGSGAMFLGFSGNSDYLPDIKDGDITLLNAKADKFAVFVRRVAIRVFHLLKQYGWDYLRASDFQSLQGYAQVNATLSPDGKILTVSIAHSSGNQQFDTILRRSVNEGGSDPNPPPAALASDGKFHFIFLARSWSQNGSASRMFERRWLSLKTGLE